MHGYCMDFGHAQEDFSSFISINHIANLFLCVYNTATFQKIAQIYDQI